MTDDYNNDGDFNDEDSGKVIVIMMMIVNDDMTDNCDDNDKDDAMILFPYTASYIYRNKK